MSNQMTGNGRDVILKDPKTAPLGTVAGSGLYARRRSIAPTAPPPEDPLVEISEKLFVALVSKLPEYAAKALEPQVGDLKIEMAAMLGKQLQKEMEVRDNDHKKALEAVMSRFDFQLVTQSNEYKHQLEELHKTIADNHTRLESLLKAMPVPQVIVPENAIHVKQDPNPVYVTAPEVHVKNDVATPSVTVNNEVRTPEVHVKNDVATPSVNVTNEVRTPEVHVKNDVATPTVNIKSEPVTVRLDPVEVKSIVQFPKTPIPLQAPPPRKSKTVKSIVYGQDGRPSEIVEETEEGS